MIIRKTKYSKKEKIICRQLENLIAKEKQKALAESLVDNINLLIGDGRSLEEACSILHSTVEKYLAAKKLLKENTAK